MKYIKRRPLILKATHINWSLSEFGVWKKTIFKLSHSRYLGIKSFYGDESIKSSSVIDESEFIKIKHLINKIIDSQLNSVIDVCDGDAWEFIMYNEEGNEIYKSTLGYIYGIDVFEKITNILNEYEPKQDKCLEISEKYKK